VAILVSRYNELVTARLLEGARACCRAAGVPDAEVDVVWVPGAFELPVVAAAAAAAGRYCCLVALGAVIRGETPHFEYVGLLTADNLQQATERAGGSAGNKGYEAAEAALLAADVVAHLGGGDAAD
jgi:6,7-dimethyl-8-ribityllumazine synthase